MKFIVGKHHLAAAIFLFTAALPSYASDQPIPQRKPLYLETQKMYEMFPGHYEYVMFGDSITERGKWEDMFPNYSIGNRGIGGDDTAGMLSRLNAVEKTGAKTVFVMAGTNDLSRHVKPDEIANNIIEISEKLRSKGIKVVIQSTIYSGTKKKKKNPSISIINNTLKNYSKSNGTPYLDLNEKLSENNVLKPEYSLDDTHLTAEGYKEWSKLLNKFLSK